MGYEVVIGLETHVELSTKSKIFCGCSTAFGGEPNAQCCPICMGMPGTLPVMNEEVVAYSVKAGLALDCNITKENRFDRKNYFYPDLPKAYQVSQLYYPICTDGGLELEGGKRIRIREIHMEEDAGKLLHDALPGATLADYNRCGVPLIEIVTQPDFRTAEEVLEYLKKLQAILQYLNVSDCKMQEGSMRADINLSVRQEGAEAYGTRTEMKNMNSFKAIGRAIAYEAKRQIELLEKGERVIQETRRWDDNKGMSYAMRSKENAQDYRYFPEPDIPPLRIAQAQIDGWKGELPELPQARYQRYVAEYGLPEFDAGILTGTKALAELFEGATEICNRPKDVSNFIMGDILRLVGEQEDMEEGDIAFAPEKLATIVNLLANGKINRQSAKKILAQVFYEDVDPVGYMEAEGLAIVVDEGALAAAVEKVLGENEKSVADYKGGKEKAFGALVGGVMKEMRGKADPATVNRMLKERLDG
ncbi:Asp-tRNA(Asn)/Glu-tRNA(Gln) amidotransferase subunit GatB [Eubacteriales bacterium OttesenSCG-928-M02]|nr:Asp-tRNA(Asn)/Glu-tRNA(Gln) amidotransferase subunit GatB [Eubacteriales bacterium OttesenSCG-928-M02]